MTGGENGPGLIMGGAADPPCEPPVVGERSALRLTKDMRELREQLQQAYFTRTLDRGAAERFGVEAWRKLGLPDIGE